MDKVVVLDESRKRREMIKERLSEKGYEVVTCSSSTDFLESMVKSMPERFLIDVESWNHGKALYSYFKVGAKTRDVGITFYNAPDTFMGIADRTRNTHDKIFRKQESVDIILSTLD